MKKNAKTGLAVAGALGGLLLLTAAMRKPKAHKAVVRPGETTERYMGSQFVLRLPRGSYTMLGGEGLTVISEMDLGNSTDLVIAVGGSANQFTVQPVFSNVDKPTEQYTITVLALPLEG